MDITEIEENPRYILRGPELKLTQESFGSIIYKGLKNGGAKIAMVDAATHRTISYNEILKSTIILADYYKNMGLIESDIISVCSENNLNYCIPLISGFYLGITVSPICCDFTENELMHVLQLSKPKIIFCSALTLGTVLKVAKDLNSVQKIILLHTKNIPYMVENLEDILSSASQCDQFEITPVEPDHNALMIFSSGTTGLPKGVLHTHKNLQSSYAYNVHPDFGNFHSNKVGMGISPFYFAFGLMRLVAMLITNMKVIVLSKFRRRLFLHSIQNYKITNIYVTPALVQFLATSPLVDEYDLSSVKEIMSGATALGKEVQQRALKRLNCTNIKQGYGLTETMAIAFSNRPGSVGKPVPGRECKIVDPDTKEVLGPYQQGELCVKGPNIMKGYIDNPVATAEIIDQDGWLHTGDVAYYDEEGFLYVVDRYKELIKFKGYQVPPAEIEDLLLKHPQVVDCAVVGKPDETVGELPTAFVVKDTNATINEKDLIKYIAENVSYQKRLHGGVKFINEIPKSPTGKILRRILRNQLILPFSKL